MRSDALAHRAAAQRHGVVTIDLARQAGLSHDQVKRRVAAGILVPIHERVYRWASSPPTTKQALVAACLALGDGAYASHRSAASLWGLPVWAPEQPEVVLLGREGVELRGVTVHHTDTLEPVDVSTCDGVPVTAVARTLLDLGAVVPLAVVESAMEHAVFRAQVSVPRLQWTLDRVGKRGRRGTATLRTILLARDPATAPTQSELETKFNRAMRRRGLPKAVRQFVVAGMRADFAFPWAKVAIELDGRVWHAGRESFQRDRERGNRFARAGWVLLRYTWADLTCRPDEVAAEILAVLSERRVA